MSHTKGWVDESVVALLFDVIWHLIGVSLQEGQGGICLLGDAIDMGVPGQLAVDVDT